MPTSSPTNTCVSPSSILLSMNPLDVISVSENEHMQKHNRFLLIGVKLSAALSYYDDSSHQTTSSSNSNDSIKIESIKCSRVGLFTMDLN
ncbi:hypothetical protein L1887_18387 [Cichorium endivia]|nr:hypothetical protein L1887_18387 [Cichorium endivia]